MKSRLLFFFFLQNNENMTSSLTLLLDYIAKDNIGWNHYVMLNAILRSYYKKTLTTHLNEGYGINNYS